VNQYPDSFTRLDFSGVKGLTPDAAGGNAEKSGGGGAGEANAANMTSSFTRHLRRR
jgi:hypothetical protein